MFWRENNAGKIVLLLGGSILLGQNTAARRKDRSKDQ